MKQLIEKVQVVLLCTAVVVLAGGFTYACEIAPMEECQKDGHSFTYCWRLLHRD